MSFAEAVELIIIEGGDLSFRAKVELVQDRDEHITLWPQVEKGLYAARAALFARHCSRTPSLMASPIVRVSKAELKQVRKLRDSVKRKVLFYVVAAKKMFGEATFTTNELATVLRLPAQKVYRALMSLVMLGEIAITAQSEENCDSAYEKRYTVVVPAQKALVDSDGGKEALYSVEDLVSAFTMTYYDVLLDLFGIDDTLTMLTKEEREELAEISRNTERKDSNKTLWRHR